MTILQSMATTTNPWLFDGDSLNRTPSIKEGLTRQEETRLRRDGAKFIQCLGADRLELHYSTVATAAVFYHRFYMFYSFKQFPVYPMAATCLFLAGKVEETPKKSNDIIKLSREILQPPEFAEFGADPKDEIFTLERILLQTLRFDLEVEHPYGHLVKYVKDINNKLPIQSNDAIQKQLLQAAWTFLNDSCCTTVCLQYEPEIIAVAMVFFACKTVESLADWNNRSPDQRFWWETYVENLETNALEDICHQVLDMYQSMQKQEAVSEAVI